MKYGIKLEKVRIRERREPIEYVFHFAVSQQIRMTGVLVELRGLVTNKRLELNNLEWQKDDVNQIYQAYPFLEGFQVSGLLDSQGAINAKLTFSVDDIPFTYLLKTKQAIFSLFSTQSKNDIDNKWIHLDFEPILNKDETNDIRTIGLGCSRENQVIRSEVKTGANPQKLRQINDKGEGFVEPTDKDFTNKVKDDALVHKNCVPRHEAISLQEHIRKLEQQLQSKSASSSPGDPSRIAKLEEELAKNQSAWEDAVKDLNDEKEKQKESFEQELQTLRDENVALKSDLADKQKLSATLDEKEKTIADLQSKNKDYEKQIASLTQERDTSKQQHEREKQKLSGEKEKLNLDIGVLNKKLLSAEKEKDESETRASALQEQLEQFKKFEEIDLKAIAQKVNFLQTLNTENLATANQTLHALSEKLENEQQQPEITAMAAIFAWYGRCAQKDENGKSAFSDLIAWFPNITQALSELKKCFSGESPSDQAGFLNRLEQQLMAASREQIESIFLKTVQEALASEYLRGALRAFYKAIVAGALPYIEKSKEGKEMRETQLDIAIAFLKPFMVLNNLWRASSN